MARPTDQEQTIQMFGSRRSISQFLAWLILSAPLVVYALIFPVNARLDMGEIESHRSGSIWRTMARNLPDVEVPTLFQIAFWLGAVVFLLGALGLVWLALSGSRASYVPASGQRRVDQDNPGATLTFDDPA